MWNYKAGEERKSFPLRILMWEATLRCNAFCEVCGSRCGEKDMPDELSAEEIRGLFRRIAEACDAKNIMINVTGGEPLLRRDLFDIMEYAVSLGFKWGIVTNGTLITDRVVEGLRKSRVSSFSISIDGMREVHDRVRRLPGAFDRIREGLFRLRKVESLEHRMITTIVSRHNIHQLEELKEYMKTLPVDIWRVGMVDPIGRAKDEDWLLLGPEGVKTYVDFLRRAKAEALPFTVTTTCSHYLGGDDAAVRDMPFTCFAGKQLGSVLSNGDIFVCANVPRRPELIQGNIRTDDFVDVWENRYEGFRDPDSRRKGKCAACASFAACRADSLHTWDFDREEPYFCYKEFGLEKEKPFSGEILSPGDLPETTFAEIIGTYRRGNDPVKAKRVRAQSPAEDRVIISPEAVREMAAFFDGKEKDEKIACLMGALYREKGRKEVFLAEVRGIAPVTPLFAGPDTIAADERLIGEAKEAAKAKGLVPLGFIHSHPGELSIAMSLGDVEWQRFLYQKDWRLALNLIVNPGRRELAAYAGPSANHVEVILLL